MKCFKFSRIIAITSALTLTVVLFAGCNGNNSNPSATNNPNSSGLSGKITINGSTSMEKLVTAFKKAYETKNSGVTIEAQTTDSSTGITAAIKKTAMIGTSSRGLKDSEKSQGIIATTVAYDGIVVIVNKENAVKDLTKEQIAKIYRGEIKNWKEVGGKDANIVVVSRESGSGTKDAFQEIIDNKAMAVVGTAVVQGSTGAVLNTIKGNINAIGYSSLGELTTDVIALKVNGIEATSATVKDNSYLIKRPFLMVVKEEDALTKEFINWVVSPEGQQIVTDTKFIKID
jgi:phosphate transport system substrate-binding protein